MSNPDRKAFPNLSHLMQMRVNRRDSFDIVRKLGLALVVAGGGALFESRTNFVSRLLYESRNRNDTPFKPSTPETLDPSIETWKRGEVLVLPFRMPVPEAVRPALQHIMEVIFAQSPDPDGGNTEIFLVLTPDSETYRNVLAPPRWSGGNFSALTDEFLRRSVFIYPIARQYYPQSDTWKALEAPYVVRNPITRQTDDVFPRDLGDYQEKFHLWDHSSQSLVVGMVIDEMGAFSAPPGSTVKWQPYYHPQSQLEVGYPVRKLLINVSHRHLDEPHRQPRGDEQNG